MDSSRTKTCLLVFRNERGHGLSAALWAKLAATAAEKHRRCLCEWHGWTGGAGHGRATGAAELGVRPGCVPRVTGMILCSYFIIGGGYSRRRKKNKYPQKSIRRGKFRFSKLVLPPSKHFSYFFHENGVFFLKLPTKYPWRFVPITKQWSRQIIAFTCPISLHKIVDKL